MHPLWLIAAAAGAFFIGRRTREEKAPGATKLTGLGKLPPPPADAEAAPVGPTYEDMWAIVPFEIEIYPAGAQRTRIPPPRKPDGITADDQCQVIALGTMWWDRVGQYAEALIAKGHTDPREIHRQILEVFAPSCIGRPTNAANALRAELVQRLEDFFGEDQAKVPKLITNPTRRGVICVPPQSFNPYPIYQSAAFHKSSIVRNRRDRTAVSR
jgi:hypothetical protein